MKLAVVLLATFCLAASQAKVIDSRDQAAEAGGDKPQTGLPGIVQQIVDNFLSQIAPNSSDSATSQRQGVDFLAFAKKTIEEILNTNINTAGDNSVSVRAEAGKPLTISLPEQAAEIAKVVQDAVKQFLGLTKPAQTNAD